MDANAYKKLMSFWERHSKLLTVADAFHSVAVGTIYLAFPFMLFVTAINEDLFCITAFAVCLISFVLLSLFRNKVNKERPSEVYGIPSAVSKTKKGKSFPSRHTFSAVIISVCLFHISATFGVAFLVISLLIAALRVLLGLHFVKDVAVGGVIGVLCGVIALIIG